MDFNNFWCFENVRVCSFTSKQHVSAVLRACTRKTALCTKKSKIIVKTRVSTFAKWMKNLTKIAEIMIISYCILVCPKRIVPGLCLTKGELQPSSIYISRPIQLLNPVFAPLTVALRPCETSRVWGCVKKSWKNIKNSKLYSWYKCSVWCVS